MPHLGAEAVGDPHLGLGALEEGGDHGRGAADRNAVENRAGRAEHPLPAGDALDPRAEVSSLAMTGAARTSASMRLPATAKGCAARANMLAMAPSLKVKPNKPFSISTRWLKLTIWQACG